MAEATRLMHKIGTREDWLIARLKLLNEEKELTRRSDDVARQRQGLPWVRVDKEYEFATDKGKASLADLFRGRSQLLIYHLMFGPDYAAPCPSCSAIADGFNGFAIHLANHDVMLWAVSRAPLQKLQTCRQRMGWTFPWASSYGSDFNFDYSVGFTEEEQLKEGIKYNYRHEAPMPANPSRQIPHAAMCGVDTLTYLRERPGVSAFALEHGIVYHTYSSYARGVDGLWGMYQWLDRAPKGRNENGPWWRRHDEYEQDEQGFEKENIRSTNGEVIDASGYAPVNGLKMYYEIEGTGDPIVFIPPAFGFAGLHSFPALTQNHSVITMDLQGNGRTADIPDRPISIEQYVKDVVALLKYLGISKADFLGESYGGNTAAMIAVRHPELVRRVVTYSATFGPPQVAHNPETTHYDQPPTADTNDIQFQRESYKKVAPDPNYWPKIYEKVGKIHWEGFSKEDLASIKAPILIVIGDHDFVRVEHAVETVKLIPNAELAVIPSASHFALYSEQERVIPIVKHFLEKPEKELPTATAETGYHPDETR